MDRPISKDQATTRTRINWYFLSSLVGICSERSGMGGRNQVGVFIVPAN